MNECMTCKLIPYAATENFLPECHLSKIIVMAIPMSFSKQLYYLVSVIS